MLTSQWASCFPLLTSFGLLPPLPLLPTLPPLPRLPPQLKGSDTDAIIGHTGPVTGLAVSKDSAYLTTSSADNRAILWNLHTADRLCYFDMETKILSVAMGFHDGQHRVVRGHHTVADTCDGMRRK